MSRRQCERGSRFQVDIEQEVRSAAAAFRDNDVEASMAVTRRLWWSSRLRGRRFAQLLREARDVTQARISVGVVERGEPGQRQAMPYFLAVLRHLVNQVGADGRNGRHLRTAGISQRDPRAQVANDRQIGRSASSQIDALEAPSTHP
jgi:hypothetical protein